MCVHFSGEIYSIHHILIQREREERKEEMRKEKKGKEKEKQELLPVHFRNGICW